MTGLPEFHLDIDSFGTPRVMFRCPHATEFTTLPTVIWKIVQRDPLTVAPSVWNTSCGCHGFIRDGVWVAA